MEMTKEVKTAFDQIKHSIDASFPDNSPIGSHSMHHWQIIMSGMNSIKHFIENAQVCAGTIDAARNMLNLLEEEQDYCVEHGLLCDLINKVEEGRIKS